MLLNLEQVEIGSPPRVRGTVYQHFAGRELPGITPACAGNSHPNPLFHLKSEDHPRVCGEQVCASDHTQYTAGSPPRVRGTVLRLSHR